jgi:DNA (cytosine-5)-methyltransferase 1
MIRPRLLDLFCCEGGAATGYHAAGFDVLGVDIEPQPRYPFPFVRGDALEFLDRAPFGFDVIHASPPCQRWADGTHDRSIHPDLIQPIRERLKRTGLPFVIENVRAAPLNDRVMICGGGLGLTTGRWQLHRHRYFESNVPLIGVPCAKHLPETISVVGHGTPSGMRKPGLPDPRMVDRRAVMEMPWASRHGTSEAIPPRYTEHIGWQLLNHLARTP